MPIPVLACQYQSWTNVQQYQYQFKFKTYFCVCRYFYHILRTILPGSKNPLAQKLFWFVAPAMASSGFGPYHGLWHNDAPSKRVVITPTSGRMMRAFVLVVFTPQPGLYHAYGTAIFHDVFFMHKINLIVNNNMILD